jgi:DNA-binding CsgD family transcriptional regulator
MRRRATAHSVLVMGTVSGTARRTSRLPLVGRREETARVRDLLEPRHGGGALVLVGEPGIGKSALLRAAVAAAEAQGRLVLAAAGVQSESCLPFGTLQQLLYPVLRREIALPREQRAVLEEALGFTAGAAPDVHRTALATLDLLSELAADAPILVVVEDAHWADPATATVLAFVARRLAAEPVVLLTAMRPSPGSPLNGLPALTVEPLSTEDAARLLDASGLHDERCRDRVLREAAGNPLALRELPLSLIYGDRDPAGPPVPLTARLESAFTQRLAGLPADAHTALLVAAAHDSTDLHEVLTAVRELCGGGTDSSVYAPVVERGVLTLEGDRLRFGHPLVRSAVYQSSTRWQRSDAHRALAGALTAEPDRRAWHLASAALGPDAEAADAVAAVAEHAHDRGAAPVVAYALERAARLTPRGTLQGRRLLRAAEVVLELGDAGRAARLLDEAAPLLTGPLDLARVALAEEGVRPPAAGDRVRIRRLAALAVTAAEADDVDLALRLLTAAAIRVWSADCGPAAREIVVRAAGDLPVDSADLRVLAVLGLADPQRHESAIEDGLRALAARAPAGTGLGLLTSPYLVSANRDLEALQAAELDRLRGQGLLSMVPQLSAAYGWTVLCLARWSTATVVADEGVRVGEELGQPVWTASNMITQAMLAAVAGDHEASTVLTDRAEGVLLPIGVGASLCGIQLVRTVNALAAGRSEEAFADAVRLYDPADPAYHRVQSGWVLADLAVAALYCGRRDEAREILDRYETGAEPTSPWTRMAIEFARPLLAADDEAEALFTAALTGRVAAWPAYRARLLLEYGSWLRRQRRVAESRHPLRVAREACDALGMTPWSERARTELRAAGEGTAAPTAAPAWTQLSPQELQIAQLAATGMSNREIGLKLFLSHRTVGSHLYRIFPKLDISSRAQLRDLIDGP